MNAFSRGLAAVLLAASVYGRAAGADEFDLAQIKVEFIPSSELARRLGELPFMTVDRYDVPEVGRYDVPPRVPDGLAPVYPYALLREGVKGNAAVAVVVDVHGVVTQSCVREATRPEFGEALVAALLATRFEPALRAGDSVTTVIGVRHEFVPSGFGVTVSRDERRMLELELKNPGAIARSASLDAPLRVAKQVNPVCPRRADGVVQAGEAVVEFLVDEDGHAHLPRVVSATEPALGFAAVQAVSAWRFERPRADGRPAVVRVKVPLKFTAGKEAVPLAKAP